MRWDPLSRSPRRDAVAFVRDFVEVLDQEVSSISSSGQAATTRLAEWAGFS
jgi:hypothetical protein